MNEGYLVIDGRQLFYREVGQGEPVLLLHCAGGTGLQWRKLMDRMADRYRLMAIDLLSHGKSDKAPTETGNEFDLEIETVKMCVDHLGAAVHLVGHSAGGGAAGRFATSHSDSVRSLVLFEPTLFGMMANGGDDTGWNDFMRLCNGMVERIDAEDESGAAEFMVDFWSAPGMYRSLPSEQRVRIAKGVRFAAEKGRRVSADPEAHSIDASAIKTPTLVLSGQKSPPAAQGVTNILASRIPGAQFCRIGGVGHMAPLTHAGEVNALIEKHIEAQST